MSTGLFLADGSSTLLLSDGSMLAVEQARTAAAAHTVLHAGSVVVVPLATSAHSRLHLSIATPSAQTPASRLVLHGGHATAGLPEDQLLVSLFGPTNLVGIGAVPLSSTQYFATVPALFVTEDGAVLVTEDNAVLIY